jgi:hypothetical protein
MSDDLSAAVTKWRFAPAQKDSAPVSAKASFDFVCEENGY